MYKYTCDYKYFKEQEKEVTWKHCFGSFGQAHQLLDDMICILVCVVCVYII